MIINVPTKRIQAISQRQTFLRVLPTRWRRKPAGIDIDRNYVIVTLRTWVALCLVGVSINRTADTVKCYNYSYFVC